MHLLREGQFGVASTFIGEADGMRPEAPKDKNEDTDMDADDESNFASIQSQELQEKFQSMYTILNALDNQDLGPAISWARENSDELEARGSNLEFELCKLQFVWLFKKQGHLQADSYDVPNVANAIAYAFEHFSRFQARHLPEIQRLASSLAYASNLPESPYATLFETSAAFNDVSHSFTREFCSLLGLSAESPLYVAATAGTIALPTLIKYVERRGSARTEWTTAQELAFETPLPSSMIYHSIFVCPVSKEQTTDLNPPMMLPCGHVLAQESLHNLAKGTKFKCPYCPSEGQLKDARQIIL